MKPVIICKYNTGSYLAYTEGKIDAWKVSEFNKANIEQKPWFDTDLFRWLLQCVRKDDADLLTAKRNIWLLVLAIAQPLQKDLTVDGLRSLILEKKLTKSWGKLAMLMYAEEQKKGSKLGKLIKLLGIWQVLFLHYPVDVAAHFSRSMPACVISDELDRYHIREQMETGEINKYTTKKAIEDVRKELPE